MAISALVQMNNGALGLIFCLQKTGLKLLLHLKEPLLHLLRKRKKKAGCKILLCLSVPFARHARSCPIFCLSRSFLSLLVSLSPSLSLSPSFSLKSGINANASFCPHFSRIPLSLISLAQPGTRIDVGGPFTCKQGFCYSFFPGLFFSSLMFIEAEQQLILRTMVGRLNGPWTLGQRWDEKERRRKTSGNFLGIQLRPRSAWTKKASFFIGFVLWSSFAKKGFVLSW